MLRYNGWLENLARWHQKADIAPMGLDGTIWGWTTLEPIGFNPATPQLCDLHGLRRIGCEDLSQGRSTSSRPREGSLHPPASVPASLLLFQAHGLTTGHLWSMVYMAVCSRSPEGWAWTIEEGTRLPHVTQAVLCPMSQPKVKGKTSQRAARDSETEDGS